MKVAILGGGFTGLAAAFYIRKKGHEVTIFEKDAQLGGLAVGFSQIHWSWTLERAYHHLFYSDKYIQQLAKDSGFDEIFFQSPTTASLYKVGDNYRIFPVDTPQDFLRFPLLPWWDKIRAAVVLGGLKFSPFLPIFEAATAVDFCSRTMGKRAWETLFATLMRKKFGKYAGNILASFMWARIKARTKKLGYIRGGFQAFVDYLEKTNRDLGVTVHKGTQVTSIKKRGEKYAITAERTEVFDAVVSTLPSPILSRLIGDLFPSRYFERFRKLKQLNAVVLILESKQKLLDKTYWLNICDPEMPLMVICQHTNFVDKKHYGGNELVYIGWYVDAEDALWNMSEQEIVKLITPHLKKINPKFSLQGSRKYLFKAPFAQPVFDKDFLKNKPDFQTPAKNFYVANLDMTYPYDRGTNFAVGLGAELAQKYFE